MFISNPSREVKTRIYKSQPIIEIFDNVRLHNDELVNKLKAILGSVSNNLAYEHAIPNKTS